MRLRELLSNHPEPSFVFNLCAGLEFGFDTGIKHPPLSTLVCKNNLSARRNPDTVTQLLVEEISKGFVIGPYATPPFCSYRINPLGIAEHKYSGKRRLIVDLSAPHNTDDTSLNELICKSEYSLSYVRVDDAIDKIRDLGAGSLMCKFDIQDAFKQIPIKPSLWHLHGIKWNDVHYFFTRLVFGCRSSPKIFDYLAQAICWIATNVYDVKFILHLLDDFLTIDHAAFPAERTMANMTHLFNSLHVPLAHRKTEGPTTCLQYLGITLDSVNMEARLPLDKLDRITALLETFLTKRKCTKRELLSLLGHLNFASRVIVQGRSFISYLLTLSGSVKELHHRVTISKSCQLELRMWHQHLSKWNGVSFFLDNFITTAPDMALFTDAAASQGFGGFFNGKWFQGRWTPDIIALDRTLTNMAFLELYPIIVAAVLWSREWCSKKIMFYCDNEATVHILQKGRSKCPAIMKLMRRLTYTAMTYNFVVLAKHLPGATNCIADSLSRFQMDRFRKLAPRADKQPQGLPTFSETILF